MLPTDPLSHIFEKQLSFGKKFIPLDQQMSPTESARWFDDILDCTVDELMEILGCLPWKHWKNYDGFSLDREAIRFEFIDLLHFVVTLALLADIKPAQFYMRHRPLNYNFSVVIKSISKQVANASQGRVLTEQTRLEIRRAMVRLGDLYQGRKVQSNVLDLLDTVFRLCVLYDMTGEDIYNYYIKKNQENFARQERGY